MGSSPVKGGMSSIRNSAPVTPVAPDPKQKSEEDEYSQQFSTAKKDKEKDKDKEGEKDGEEDKGEGKTILTRFSSMIFGKKRVEAKLGEENNFEYNEELKMWVEKGKPLPTIEPPPAFPPAEMSTSTTTFSPAQGDAPLSDSTEGLPPMGMNRYSFVSPSTSGKRKPRYFDHLNQQVYEQPASSPTQPQLPPPGVRVFTPMMPQ